MRTVFRWIAFLVLLLFVLSSACCGKEQPDRESAKSIQSVSASQKYDERDRQQMRRIISEGFFVKHPSGLCLFVAGDRLHFDGAAFSFTEVDPSNCDATARLR